MTKNKFILYSILILFIVIIDQSSKTYLISYLKSKNGYLIEVTEFFDVVYSWNYGASFGFMRNYFQYSNYSFLILNSFITFVLIWLLARSKNNIDSIAFSMVIGGAIGNIIDRIIRGAVFDFIYLHYDNIAFPAFNFADSFITIGAILYFINYYTRTKNS